MYKFIKVTVILFEVWSFLKKKPTFTLEGEVFLLYAQPKNWWAQMEKRKVTEVAR